MRNTISRLCGAAFLGSLALVSGPAAASPLASNPAGHPPRLGLGYFPELRFVGEDPVGADSAFAPERAPSPTPSGITSVPATPAVRTRAWYISDFTDRVRSEISAGTIGVSLGPFGGASIGHLNESSSRVTDTQFYFVVNSYAEWAAEGLSPEFMELTETAKKAILAGSFQAIYGTQYISSTRKYASATALLRLSGSSEIANTLRQSTSSINIGYMGWGVHETSVSGSTASSVARSLVGATEIVLSSGAAQECHSALSEFMKLITASKDDADMAGNALIDGAARVTEAIGKSAGSVFQYGVTSYSRVASVRDASQTPLFDWTATHERRGQVLMSARRHAIFFGGLVEDYAKRYPDLVVLPDGADIAQLLQANENYLARLSLELKALPKITEEELTRSTVVGQSPLAAVKLTPIDPTPTLAWEVRYRPGGDERWSALDPLQSGMAVGMAEPLSEAIIDGGLVVGTPLPPGRIEAQGQLQIRNSMRVREVELVWQGRRWDRGGDEPPNPTRKDFVAARYSPEVVANSRKAGIISLTLEDNTRGLGSQPNFDSLAYRIACQVSSAPSKLRGTWSIILRMDDGEVRAAAIADSEWSIQAGDSPSLGDRVVNRFRTNLELLQVERWLTADEVAGRLADHWGDLEPAMSQSGNTLTYAGCLPARWYWRIPLPAKSRIHVEVNPVSQCSSAADQPGKWRPGLEAVDVFGEPFRLEHGDPLRIAYTRGAKFESVIGARSPKQSSAAPTVEYLRELAAVRPLIFSPASAGSESRSDGSVGATPLAEASADAALGKREFATDAAEYLYLFANSSTMQGDPRGAGAAAVRVVVTRESFEERSARERMEVRTATDGAREKAKGALAK